MKEELKNLYREYWDYLVERCVLKIDYVPADFDDFRHFMEWISDGYLREL